MRSVSSAVAGRFPPPHDERPDRALRDQVGGVHGDPAALEPVVAAGRDTPRPCASRSRCPRRTRSTRRSPGAPGQRPLVHRRVRQPVLADHLQGDPCAAFALWSGSRSSARSEWACMSMNPGQDEPFGVQLPHGPRPLAAGRRGLLDDGGDPPAVDDHIGPVRRPATAVDHLGVPHDQVFHAGLPDRSRSLPALQCRNRQRPPRRDALHALSPHRPKARVRPVRGLPSGTPRARTGRRSLTGERCLPRH